MGGPYPSRPQSDRPLRRSSEAVMDAIRTKGVLKAYESNQRNHVSYWQGSEPASLPPDLWRYQLGVYALGTYWRATGEPSPDDAVLQYGRLVVPLHFTHR